MAETSDNRVEVLRLVLADVEKERDRLRDARGSFAARLGPLPASAAVVTGIIAAAANQVDWPYAAAAGLVFGVLVTITEREPLLQPRRRLSASTATSSAAW